MPNHMLELVFSWYLASSCWCLALSCARSKSVEGELYPKLMTVIRSYCAGCRLWPLLLRLPQLRRTIQYHYFHFDRSPLQELVLRTQGRWPRACYALGPAGSSSRYVSVWLVRFLPRIDLWFSDCYLFMVLSWIHFGLVLCVFEPMYLLSASFA